MNKRAKRLFQHVFLNPLSWAVLSPFIWLSERLKASYVDYKGAGRKKELTEKADQLFSERVVRNGPFKGMEFGNVNPGGSSYYAKLLGSYETEIHPFIEDALKKHFTQVVNIGCDEGYYAVGLAMRMPGVQVFAFDTDNAAQKACERLAVMNGVEKRITIGGAYTEKDAIQHELLSRSLLVVDCEGSERDIFTKRSVSNFVNSDLILELHLQKYPDMLAYFRELFGETHNFSVVNSIDDHLKAHTYCYPELAQLDYDLKHFITEERTEFQQWIYLASKSFAPQL